MFGQIYQVYDKNTFKVLYVGSTKNLYNRIRQHKHHTLKPTAAYHNRKCYQEFRKVGFENLIFECVYSSNDFVNREEMRKKEQQYFTQLNPSTCQVNAYLSDTLRKERRTEYNKKVYQKHKPAMMLRNKAPYTCECGCTMTRIAKYRHFESQKHKNLLEKKQLIEQIAALS